MVVVQTLAFQDGFAGGLLLHVVEHIKKC